MVCAILLAGVLAASGSNDVTLLQFTADWCGACQSVKPTVQRLTAAGFPVRQVNVDQERDLVAQFRVTAVPCFVLVANGREIDRVAEAASYARLVQMFERAGRTAGQTNAPGTMATNQGAPDQASQRGPIGLPRPLASLANNLGKRRDPEKPGVRSGANPSASSVVQIDTSSATLAPVAPSDPVASQIARADRSPQHLLPPDLHQLALRSTVRLRVDDLSGHSVGTGTIIDLHQNEALIVTCGHIFRDSSGKGHIAVDLFSSSTPKSVTGSLISYDLERDLAFVAIPADSQLTAVKVAPSGTRFERGQEVFSLGCDRGGDPTVRESRITGIDRYVGAPNLEVAGQPTEGRSGGGLFSHTGELIGVCNAADPKDNEGIFASLPAVHWELDRIGQQRIYAGTDTQLAQQFPRSEPAPTQRPANVATTAPQPTVPGRLSPVPPQANVAIQPATAVKPTDDTEVICIVRSRANPEGTEQLLILDRPSRDLLDRLATESRGKRLPELAQQATPQASPQNPVRESFPVRPPFGESGQVIRAQSDDR